MADPLALVLYQKLLPGTQIVNKLQDLSYRVQTVSRADDLVKLAEKALPLVVVADLDAGGQEVSAALKALRNNQRTSHIPVIAFSAKGAVPEGQPSETSGITLLVSETAVLNHLPECLERALEV